jgi:hypothetical protein
VIRQIFVSAAKTFHPKVTEIMPINKNFINTPPEELVGLDLLRLVSKVLKVENFISFGL